MNPSLRAALLRAAITFGLLVLLFTWVADPREVWVNLHLTVVERPLDLGVVFRGEPQSAGPVITVLFEDGCGNLLNLVQMVT